MSFAFGADAFSWIFFGLVTVMWTLVGIFTSKYGEAKHLAHMKRFYIFYTLTYISLAALCFAKSFLSMYLCFEFMTFLSMPLVAHEERPEAIAAAKKYLFYSVFGASLALIGLFYASKYANGIFTTGGMLNMELVAGHEKQLLVVIFLTIVGFGAKAGLYPLHGWLPIAHPEAPGPASSVLSGVITKAGVLCIIRTIFFVFGPDIIKGTWVQYTLMCMAMLTIFMGSLMAYNQRHFKKRLAYSTVSQVSYILIGIFALNPIALTGSLLHIIYHAIIKDILFLVAASVIYSTKHIHYVNDLEGLGRVMPWSFGCFTIASLGLVGIPPFAGFLSKWYLATGILADDIPVISWMGPAVLLASALMTAAYLLSICIKAFFPRKDLVLDLNEYGEPVHESPKQMVVPMVILAAFVVILGIAAQPWANLFLAIAEGVF